MDRRPVFARKHPFLGIKHFSVSQSLFLPLRTELLEFCGKLGAHIDLALRCFRFRRLHLEVMRNIPPYDDVVFREVDVNPLKRRRLPDPHSGPTAVQISQDLVIWTR